MTKIFDDIVDRCDAIEECYEFMLAYAAQGLPDDHDSRSGSQLRELLSRAVQAASGLAEAYAALLRELRIDPAEHYQAFLGVLERDIANALAAVQLVLPQPKISSQLIDNLNASIHLRTLLTDIFLIDEVVKLLQTPSDSEPRLNDAGKLA